MPFEPQGPNHAIIEAVFGFQLARNVTASEVDLLIAVHDKVFKADLPRINRTQVMMIGALPANLQFTPPVPGVSFDSIKKDGSLEWRLRVDDNSLLVNCLDYSRWSQVWPKARDYLAAASEILLATDNAVTGVLLQYIDVFRWAGKVDDYDVGELLDVDSDHVPLSVLDCQPLWHLHQGWYRTDNLPVPGRILERVHLDAVLDDNGTPVVKVDTYMLLELAMQQNKVATFGGSAPMAEKVFGGLHSVNKALLKSFLTQDMAKKINLG